MKRYAIPLRYHRDNVEQSARWLMDQLPLTRQVALRWFKTGMKWDEAERFAVSQGDVPDAMWDDWEVPSAGLRLAVDVATCRVCSGAITLGEWLTDSQDRQAREWTCGRGHRGVLALSMEVLEDAA